MTNNTEAEQGQRTPKAFLSYSRSSPDYIERVAGLADRLVSHGVDVVFDLWDLSEGQDLHAFMERSVVDPTVSHVLILCDPLYAEKANGREKGVGKETLIISPAVYSNASQKRVIPVIMERDSAGLVQTPAYLEGRFFVDLSIQEDQATGYEQLLRLLFGKPARTRPPLGRAPEFLSENAVQLRTSGALLLLKSAVVHNRPSTGLLADYLDRLLEAFSEEELKESVGTEGELIKGALDSIDRFRPYRDEFIGICQALSRHQQDPSYADRLHWFFERLATVRRRHRRIRWDESAEAENLGFLAWELFLYCIAVLLNEQAYSAASTLLGPMLVESYTEGSTLEGLAVLDPGFLLLDRWKVLERLNVQDPGAHLARQRNAGTTVRFEALMEAELLLWYRTATVAERQRVWYPRTLIYLAYNQRFPLFERARQAGVFAKVGPVLGVLDREAFVRRFREIPPEVGNYFPLGFSTAGPGAYARLLGIDSAT